MKGQKNSPKPYPDLVQKKLLKTIPGPMRSYILKENHIGSVVNEINKKIILLYIIGLSTSVRGRGSLIIKYKVSQIPSWVLASS